MGAPPPVTKPTPTSTPVATDSGSVLQTQQPTQSTEETGSTTRKKKKTNPDALPEGHMLFNNLYKVEKVLGQGGFGLTYKAYDTQLDTHVAIKEYLPTQIAHRQSDLSIHARSDEQEEMFIQGRQRFLDEARTLAKFKHSSLVRVVTFFEDNNTAYMAMEFEAGEPLSALLKAKRTLNEKEMLDIMLPLIQGVQVLHNEGYIHRDIKPDNIFIRSKDGTPVLLDFGSARRQEGNADGSMTAMLTPSYAPMEQYFEEAARQGPWTDIYSLGAVMYRCISGRKPIGAPQRSNAIMRNAPDPLNPAVSVGEGHYSEAMLKAVDLALRVIETERPQSIPEWMNAVSAEKGANDFAQEVLAGEEGAQDKKTKAIIFGLAAAVVLALGLAIFVASESSKGPRKLTQAEIFAQQFKELEDKANQGDITSMYDLGMRYAEGRGARVNQSKAVDWFTRAAEAGHAQAQSKLGAAYQNGTGAPQDSNLAIQWYMKAAEQGQPEAQYQYALALATGAGIEQDQNKSLDWMEKAAENGVPQAQLALAQAYHKGQGRPQDMRNAFQWYLRAAEQNVADAMYAIAEFYEKGLGTEPDMNKAEHFLRQSAELGSLDAQIRLAHILIEANGLNEGERRREAVKWFRSAASQGDIESQFQLARAMDLGLGTRPDITGALNNYTKAAEQGHLKSQLILATTYLTGKGVPRDTREAFKWFKKAAEQGSSVAQNRMGISRLQGIGAPKDLPEAFRWFSMAAEQGEREAQVNLATLYEKGMGVIKDMEKAVYWYRKAAEQGDARAQGTLGWLYEEGKGVQRDIGEAAKWYSLAAEQGDHNAQKNLGWMYETGRGVKKDPVQAYLWYAIAGAYGDKEAQRNLALLMRTMSNKQKLEGDLLAKQWVSKQQQRAAAEKTSP
ncbi:putative serine/threonine protein kinase [Magnetofaba australis IT-1]|uniref:Putative serine/threonine protein kinase n=2 Tax=Magnetofaba TaxID=1472292 RepID=A0A1Y2K5V1_9PROT|nr:putative serine/threonine protein kinase [Magnetofaba australis IT-1]